MNRETKKHLLFILFCLIIAALSLYPYLLGPVNIEHDTCFHLSRIEGLARSFQDGVVIPRIYPYKNHNFGYGSPMFYSDFFLIIPALLYLSGVSLAGSYQIFLFICSFFSAWFMGLLVKRISKNRVAMFISSALYLFCTYRFTDIYVRGALGEVVAFVFLPVALIGIFEVLAGNPEQWRWLAGGFTGLLLSHNITFLLGCLLFACFLISYIKPLRREPDRFFSIGKAILLTLGLCAFYLFPMLEQMTSQQYYLHYYGSSSSLELHALNAWQFTEPRLIFGVSGNGLDSGQAMTTNLGLLIPLLPLLGLLNSTKKTDNRSYFLRICIILGYGFFFFCSRLFPWKYMTFLRILQFPWRFMGLASVLLSLSSGIIAAEFFKKYKYSIAGLIIVMTLLIGMIQISDVSKRQLVFSKSADYTELIDSTIIDPYYGDSFYVRPEIAGADYLPVASIDYRSVSRCVTGENGQELACELSKKGTETRFTVSSDTKLQIATVPVTWYKGYSSYFVDEAGNKIKLQTTFDLDTHLVSIDLAGINKGEVILHYQGTWIQKLSEFLTLGTCITWLLQKKFDLKKKSGSY